MSVSAGVSAILISNGWATNASATALTTFLLGIVPNVAAMIWGIWAHSRTNTIASASALPEVQSVVTSPEIAHSVQFAANNKVVTFPESQRLVSK